MTQQTTRTSPVCITLEDWLNAGLSYYMYENDKKRGYLDTAGRAGGEGNGVRIIWQSIKRQDRRQILLDYLGYDPAQKESENPLAAFFEIRMDAREWYSGCKLKGGLFPTPDQVTRWTTNASTLLAVKKLYEERCTLRNRLGHSTRGVWVTVINDLRDFNNWLYAEHGVKHTLPISRRLQEAVRGLEKHKWEYLVDGRAVNQNRQKVTPEMIDLWQHIYAGQKEQKPDYTEVHRIYEGFLDGTREIVCQQSGEIFDHTRSCYKPVGKSTVYHYQSDWEHGAPSKLGRQGDRQKALNELSPHHRMHQPGFAGSIISIDDRQPPFAYDNNKNRMWFYNAIDLGSEAFTCWVYGKDKKDLILPFYRQLVRNYANWGFNLPYEIECEMSLNSSFRDSFLRDGVMFQKVRIEANNARAKRIEAYYKPLRYAYEKKREGWLARPFALSESNQPGPDKPTVIPPERIVRECLLDIEKWNNQPHSNQELHPGLTRWQVFEQKQHQNLTPTNWAAILPLMGYRQPSSMHKGRIKLQGQERVVGWNGQVALGSDLIDIMKQIEGKDVVVYWIDDAPGGDVLKAMVYDTKGRLVCELLDDLSWQRAALEQTPADLERKLLFDKYKTTIDSYLERGRKAIKKVVVIDHSQDKPFNNGKQFRMPGLERYEPGNEPARNLGPIDTAEDHLQDLSWNNDNIIDPDDTLSRF